MKRWSILIVALVIVLMVVPLVVKGNAEFGGSDDQGTAAIKQIDPSYKPWFHSLWTPPSAEIESLTFALQAAVGAGLVFYALGYYVGRAKGRDQAGSAFMADQTPAPAPTEDV